MTVPHSPDIDARQIGLLAIAMQRAYDRVMAWLEAQGKANRNVKAADAPDWVAFSAAKAAFDIALKKAARGFKPANETAIGLAEKAKGRAH